VPERLVVPFRSVKAFYDPSSQFGLQFGKPGAANDSARQHLAGALPDLVGDSDEGRPPLQDTAASEEPSEPAQADVMLTRPPAEVVQLDRFRKK
jgi:hypothetical protein